MHVGRKGVLATGALLCVATCTFVTTRVRADNVRKPFLLQWAVRNAQPDGSLRTEFVLTMATRSDGAWMQDSAVVADGVRPKRSIVLPRERKYLSYDPEINAAFSASLSDVQVTLRTEAVPQDCLLARHFPPSGRCVDEGKNVLGHPVLTLTSEFREVNGTIRRTVELVSPELNYQTLAVTFYENGKLSGEKAPLYLAVGEPAPGLFTVPEGVEFVANNTDLGLRSEAARGRIHRSGLEKALEQDAR